MKIKTFTISISFLFFFQFYVSWVPSVLAYRTETFSDAFIPDSNVMKLAQEFDRKYFPLFLKALEEIETGATTLIAEFFNRPDRNPASLLKLPALKDFETNIIPVYFNPAERSSYEIPFPVNWLNPRYPDPSWNLWFKSLRWLNPYLSCNDHDTVLMALKVIDDYIINHTTYPDANSRFTFGDHSSAERLLTLVRAWNKYIGLNYYIPKFENRLLTAILSNIFLIASLENYNSWHNHAIISDRCLIDAVSDMPNFKYRAKFLELAFLRVFEVYRYSYSSEGIHKEHSPCYHRTFTNSLNRLIDRATENEIEIPEVIIEIASKANQYGRYITINNQFMPVGDCNRIMHSRKLNDKYTHGFKVYPITGWTFIRDSLLNLSIIAQSNFHSFAHYQQQETSFILNVAGHELIIDPGLLTYNRSSPYYEYMRSAKGHNVLLADCRSFDSRIENTGLAGITRYYQDPKNSISSNGIVEMTHPHYHDMGVEIHRQLAFAGNNAIIIKDIITSDSVRTYTQQFHLAPGAEVKKERKHLIVQWEEHPYYLKISSNAKDFLVIEGEMDPVQGWYFPAFNVAEPCPLLILKVQGANKEIITRIGVHKQEMNQRPIKVRRKVVNNLFKGLDEKKRGKLKHEPFPKRWRPLR